MEQFAYILFTFNEKGNETTSTKWQFKNEKKNIYKNETELMRWRAECVCMQIMPIDGHNYITTNFFFVYCMLKTMAIKIV